MLASPFVNDDEIQTICSNALMELRGRDPELSLILTRRLNGPQYKFLTKNQRKLEKIRLLHSWNHSLFLAIFNQLNWQLKGERISPDNFFDLLDRKLMPLNPFREITGGNFSSRM